MATSPSDDRCPCCGAHAPAAERIPLDALRPSLAERIVAREPSLTPDARVCRTCLFAGRADEVMARLEQERGELGDLERLAAQRAAEHTAIARRLDDTFSSSATVGDRAADVVASFGGSWTFVLGLGGLLVTWITANALAATRAFDPYPFILLNLALSTVAAFQAPLILMSQNRQSARDRLEADQDFLVNLKAEIEVGGLHDKLDHLLHVRWQDLLELQAIQTDMLQDVIARLEATTGASPTA